MEITFSHHKGADRKLKPTTFLFHEEALPILCPISHVLAIAVKDDAIEVEGSSHAEPFFRSHLQHPTKAVLIHWKPEMLKRPIFRQAVRMCDMFRMSEWKALRYLTYAYYLDRLGWATGFEQKLTSYCFRRGTGNAVDGAATTAVRDQILRHNPQTGIFCGSYNNEKVRRSLRRSQSWHRHMLSLSSSTSCRNGPSFKKSCATSLRISIQVTSSCDGFVPSTQWSHYLVAKKSSVISRS